MHKSKAIVNFNNSGATPEVEFLVTVEREYYEKLIAKAERLRVIERAICELPKFADLELLKKLIENEAQ